MSLSSEIDNCLLPKLLNNFDESDQHNEFETRKERLEKHFNLVLGGLSELNLRENLSKSPEIFASVLILYKELLTKGPWHFEEFTEYAKKLNLHCVVLFEIKLRDLLEESHAYNPQKIFNECMQKLHHKLTSSDFKKYPSLLEVYCSLVDDIRDNKNISVDVKAFPISLYLIDDFNKKNKKKGLICCETILKQLEPEIFTEGNYYEVIYVSLKKALIEGDIAITKLVVGCLMELLRTVPKNCEFKLSASEELYANTLDQIQTESNLYRKAALFGLTKYLIEIIGVNAVSRKIFEAVICDNLHISCNEGVEMILLFPVIECLEEWIKNCWCVWKINTGQKMLAALFKALYICSDESTIDRIARIIATLISLCDPAEKDKIVEKLKVTKIINDKLLQRVELVNKYIYAQYTAVLLRLNNYHNTSQLLCKSIKKVTYHFIEVVRLANPHCVPNFQFKILSK